MGSRWNDIPPPPEAICNVINKLAEFVARNGPQFENMTKEKQRDNPKFAFLFEGDENHGFYKQQVNQFVNKNQQNSRWEGQTRQHPARPKEHETDSSKNAEVSKMELERIENDIELCNTQEKDVKLKIEALNSQQESLRNQVSESTLNLRAQRKHFDGLEKEKTASVIIEERLTDLQQLSAETSISLDSIDRIVEPIITSCTKDSIVTGKGWIFQNATNQRKNMLITRYLAHKVTADHLKHDLYEGCPTKPQDGETSVTFSTKLHIIYLLNDVVHHCVRKKFDELKEAFESVVVEMYCSAYEDRCFEPPNDTSKRQKLTKLINLWKDKDIFSRTTLDKMQNCADSWKFFVANQSNLYQSSIKKEVTLLNETYDTYKYQHNEFEKHANLTMESLDKQVDDLQTELKSLREKLLSYEKQKSELTEKIAKIISNSSANQVDEKSTKPSRWGGESSEEAPPGDVRSSPMNDRSFGLNSQIERQKRGFQSEFPDQKQNNPEQQGPFFPPVQGMSGALASGPFGQMSIPPPTGPFANIPNLSVPPPGFSAPPPPTEPIVPALPYYELPAGLMVPLIHLEDCEYKPVNPRDIRLPPPTPPSEALLQAVEMFYSGPSRDRPRDVDGWELTGLYEWFKEKSAVIKKRQEDIKSGERRLTPPHTPNSSDELSDFVEGEGEVEEASDGEKAKNENDSKVEDESSKKKVEIAVKQRVFREQPEEGERVASVKDDDRDNRRDRRSRRRSYTPSSSDDERRGSRRPSPDGRRRTRRSPRRRTPSPPSNAHPATTPVLSSSMQQKLSESNKGHQMMERMGWKSGSGLGSSSTGIVEPIKGGEVRDRDDMFRGVGSQVDAFDEYRKSRSGWYVNRIRDRERGEKD